MLLSIVSMSLVLRKEAHGENCRDCRGNRNLRAMNANSLFAVILLANSLLVDPRSLAQEPASFDRVVLEGATVEVHEATFGTVHSPKMPSGSMSLSGGENNRLVLWVSEKGGVDIGPILLKITDLD